MASVAVLVAHPDDELLGVGGTILRHVAAGDDVTVHIECIRNLRDEYTRVEEAERLAAVVGYRLSLGRSSQLAGVSVKHQSGYTLVPFHRPVLDHLAADIIYTHHPGDLNSDHRLVAEAAFVAGRYASAVRTFETVSSTEWGFPSAPFVPNYFVGIDLAAKVALLDLYRSELRDFPHPRSTEAVEALARLRGSTAGLEAAEAFVTVRERW